MITDDEIIEVININVLPNLCTFPNFCIIFILYIISIIIRYVYFQNL